MMGEKTRAPTERSGQEPALLGPRPGPLARLDLCVRGARIALEVAEVTGAVLQAEAGLVALSHLLACGCIQQVIVAELIHAVVMSGVKGQEEEREGGLVTAGLPETGQAPDQSLVPCVPRGRVSGAPLLARSPWRAPPWDSSLPCWAPTWTSLPWAIPCILDISVP